MINYIVYTVIIIILIFVSAIATKAIKRGIKAKRKFNEENHYDQFEKKTNIDEKD